MTRTKIIIVLTLVGLSAFGCSERNFGELVCLGDTQGVERALRRGADPNAFVGKGWLPLNLAVDEACRGSFELVKLLVERGADVNRKDRYGVPPIVAAKGNWSAVKLLIENGADVNATDSRGHTALMGYPIGGEQIEELKGVYEMFAAAGADLEKVAPDGSSTKSWLRRHRPELVAYVDELIAKKKRR